MAEIIKENRAPSGLCSIKAQSSPGLATNGDRGALLISIDRRRGSERLKIGNLELAMQRYKLCSVKKRELSEKSLALFREPHFDQSPVLCVHTARNKANFLASRDKRHHSMVFGLQSFRQFAYRRPFAAGESLDVQEKQILQRGYTEFLGDLFAHPQESAQLVAKIGEDLVFPF